MVPVAEFLNHHNVETFYNFDFAENMAISGRSYENYLENDD